ncbi:futalosine hydrolase [Kitasatospora sp. NPDC002965]|uniref:futalosine hydrolase n=1 Tax=Kitasatospora sp. NPDC002965 TaxID=3154775 RepID=UPI0033BF2A82
MTARLPDEQSGPARARLLVVVAVAPEAEAVLRGLTAAGACASPSAPATAQAATHATAHASAGPAAPAAPDVRWPGGAPDRVEHPSGVTVDVLAGGVGPAAAAAAAATALTAARYDLVVSAGIAGGFAPQAPVGATVIAEHIVAADLGAETPEGFADVTELGFGTVRHTPAPAAVALAAEALAAVAGTVLTGPVLTGTVLTVSTVTGSAGRAAELAARHPRVAAEAMEGFGVAEAAARHGVPVFELRTVSNPVGPRDRAAWRIGDALAALERAFAALPYPELLTSCRNASKEAGRG